MYLTPSVLFSLLVRGFLIYAGFSFFKIIYDVWFGPLSKIPGPKLAAATRLVLFYHLYAGDAEPWRLSLHEKYGDVVRTTPSDVSFATGKVWKDIYGHGSPSSGMKDNMRRDPKFYIKPPTDKTWSLMNAPDDTHTRQRKMLGLSFSDRALMRQESMLHSYVAQLLSNLAQVVSRGEKTDMVKNYNFTTFDIMAQLTFDEPLGCLQNSEYSPWISLIFASLTLLVFLTEMNHYALSRYLIGLLIPIGLKKQRGQSFRNTEILLDKRFASTSTEKRSDIWGLAHDTNSEKDEEQLLQPDEMRANASLFMIAGTETSATLLSAVTFHLLRNADKLQILTNELRSTFSSVDDINLTQLGQLPYLNACINEALRIHPPVPMGLPRVTPKGGAEICGYYLPENTTVSIHHYATYLNPKSFAKPYTFAPERWLPNPPAEFANDDLAAVQPFLVGPRNCLGITLAWFEMRLILASVLFSYDLTLCEESTDWNKQKVYMLWEKKPLMVTLKHK